MSLVTGSSGSAVKAVRSDPTSYINSPVVTICVGTSEKQYFIHKALLTAYSPYFNACLGSSFVEGQTLEVILEEEDETAFDIFASWLYTGKLDNVLITVPQRCDQTIKSYKLADRLLVPDLKNLVVDELRHRLKLTGREPLPCSIALMRRTGLISSKLAQFFVRYFVWSRCTGNQARWSSDANDNESIKRRKSVAELHEDNEAVVYVLQSVFEFVEAKWGNPIDARDCDFHEHEDGKRCSR